MLFNSFVFLLCFLGISTLVYYIVPNKVYKNIILLIVSIIFYSWSDYKLIFIILAEAIFTYFAGILIAKSKGKLKKLCFIFSLLIVIGILVYYKYTGFIFETLKLDINFEIAGLPLGISFYTFNIISYLTDVYRETIKEEINPFYTVLYLLFFPFVLSGPLQRYDYMKDQFINRKFNINTISNGLRRFVIGLGKKVLIANNLAIVSDYVFKELSISDYTSSICWLGAIAYSLQLFFDFAGYSDMAIGLANVFGFTSKENFNYPYMASSITDFWRRWHISLSTWFKDYIYIPLGGNRVGKLRWYFNLFVVWAVTGLWHGAAFNYVLWGIYFCILLIIEKLFLLNILKKAYVIRNIYSILAIVVGWVIFNCSSIEQISAFLKTMFTSFPLINLEMLNSLGYIYLVPCFVAGIILSVNYIKKLYDLMNKNVITGMICDVVLVFILVACFVYMINASYSPFLYFQY